MNEHHELHSIGHRLLEIERHLIEQDEALAAIQVDIQVLLAGNGEVAGQREVSRPEGTGKGLA